MSAPGYAGLRVFLVALATAFVACGTANAQRCKPGDIEVERTDKYIRCKPGPKKLQCIKGAGEQLNKDLKVGCAEQMGACLRNNKITFDGSVLACVAGCATFAGCLTQCGVSGAIDTTVVLQCWDDNTSCKVAAMDRHKKAVAACQQ